MKVHPKLRLLWPIHDSQNDYYECVHGCVWYEEVCDECTTCPQCGFMADEDMMVLSCPECQWYREGWADSSHWYVGARISFDTSAMRVEFGAPSYSDPSAEDDL